VKNTGGKGIGTKEVTTGILAFLQPTDANRVVSYKNPHDAYSQTEAKFWKLNLRRTCRRTNYMVTMLDPDFDSDGKHAQAIEAQRSINQKQANTEQEEIGEEREHRGKGRMIAFFFLQCSTWVRPDCNWSCQGRCTMFQAPGHPADHYWLCQYNSALLLRPMALPERDIAAC